jgi:hypothetical protein
MSEPSGQLRTEIPARKDDGSPLAVISAGRDVELGARSMLVLAEGLFRLDVIPHEDTIQTLVRSLSPEARAEFRSDDVGGASWAFGDSEETVPRSTGRFGGDVVLIGEDGGERTVARVLVGSVCHLERGMTSFTAQATLLAPP